MEAGEGGGGAQEAHRTIPRGARSRDVPRGDVLSCGMSPTAEIAIVGAGIAGVAAAYHLAVRQGVRHVVLIDEREPLTLTSAVGTQGYRNWWPGPDDTMCRFVSRSIGILDELADECDNAFRLSRRGYLFATARGEGVDDLRRAARTVSAYGMGEVREHTESRTYEPARAEGYAGAPGGADLLTGDALRTAFPYLATDTSGALHVRRAGWMNAVALGAWMLRRAVGAGVTVVRDRVVGIDASGGRVQGVRLASGAALSVPRVVVAAGPTLPAAARLLGIDLPVRLELHAKMTFRDVYGALPRSAPFCIWNDPVEVSWAPNERETFAAGAHVRPVDGPHGDEAWLIWTYDDVPCETAQWPPSFDPRHGEILLRGVAHMIPAFAAYAGRGADGVVDGGYYCKTPENRPLVGPCAVDGAYLCAAFSGFGIMAAHAGGELLAAHVTGAPLPGYAGALLPARYDDAAYTARLETLGTRVGQL